MMKQRIAQTEGMLEFVRQREGLARTFARAFRRTDHPKKQRRDVELEPNQQEAIMNSELFRAQRITRTYCQTIEASPEQVFPLLCPVREAEWLDGWRYSMVYSESGLVEEGAVFSTPGEGEPDTV